MYIPRAFISFNDITLKNVYHHPCKLSMGYADVK